MAKLNKKQKKKLEEILTFCGKAAENFRLFTSEIIGYDNAPFHEELDDYLSNAFMHNLVIALPRGFGKTNHAAIAYPLWEIARNHDLRILLVSSTAELSRKSLTSIMDHIDRNPKYRAWAKILDGNGLGVIPRQKARQKRDEQWSNDSITIDRSQIALRDATIQAVGLFGSIVSRRADIVIVDDICTQENSANEEQRQKVKDWFHSTLLPVLVPGGRVICLGNTWHMDDLMNNLLKDPQFQVKKRVSSILREASRHDLWEEWANILLDESLTPEARKARSDEYMAKNKKEMDEGIELLWPERFPYANLYLTRISDPFSFARMFMCDPSIRPNQKFFEKDIELALNKGKDMVLQDEERTEYETEFTTGGLDLASTQETWGDDTVLLTLDRVLYGSADGLIKPGDYVIRNIRRGKFSPDQTRRMVVENEKTVRPLATRVEANGMQHMMYVDLSNTGAMVTSYTTGGEKNDPAIGVYSLAILFEQHKIILPNNPKDAHTRRLVAQLVNEMRFFPDGHTGDALMAFWFAFSEMRDRTNSGISFPKNEESIIKDPPKGEAAEKIKKTDEWYADQKLIYDQRGMSWERFFECQEVVWLVKKYGYTFEAAIQHIYTYDAREQSITQQNNKRPDLKKMTEFFGEKKDEKKEEK